MLALGLRLYRSSNLVLDLKMWENFESNLPVCVMYSSNNSLQENFMGDGIGRALGRGFGYSKNY